MKTEKSIELSVETRLVSTNLFGTKLSWLWLGGLLSQFDLPKKKKKVFNAWFGKTYLNGSASLSNGCEKDE